mgnify:CR=1 FL=1
MRWVGKMFGFVSLLCGLLIGVLGIAAWANGGYWAVLAGAFLVWIGMRYMRNPDKLKTAIGNMDAAMQTKNTPVLANPDIVVSCPKCGSTQVSGSEKGYGLGKAAVGGVVTGSPIGLLGGLIGSKKAMVNCLNCGHRWEAGK